MAKATKNAHEFTIKLEGVALSKDAQARIEAGLQSIVLQELAGRPGPDDTGSPRKPINNPIVVIPLPIPGKLIRVYDPRQLEQLEQIKTTL